MMTKNDVCGVALDHRGDRPIIGAAETGRTPAGRGSRRSRSRSGVWLLFLALPFAFAVRAGQAADALPPAPQLVCEQPLYDFGQAANTGAVSHVFVIANRGTAPLTIDRIHACCGASAHVAENTVAAGSNTTLEITLSLQGRQGAVNKAVYVHSNDPQCRIYQLRMIGTIVAPGTTAVTNRGVASVPAGR